MNDENTDSQDIKRVLHFNSEKKEKKSVFSFNQI